MIYEILSMTKKSRRKEYIDTDSNELFQTCKNVQQVEKRYSSFWKVSGKNTDLIVIAFPCNGIESKGSNWGIEVIEL